ncbi:hypothetical protein [Emticicia fluvialis]|uniref:hypothetical protein n=1 Tax=Emticicia fluvialis TaxID=2974474 RepID=UPI0021669304|nr:hypothetical protein [Emticicia fluvialis]
MKNSAFLLLIILSISFSSCSFDSVENDANRLSKLVCEGERTSDPEKKKKIREEYQKLTSEFKDKYKNRQADAIKVAQLHFQKIEECLGYLPVR